MPRKKQTSMFDTDFELEGEKKLPTLRQYLKELPKDAELPSSPCRIVWFPGEWKNYTIQTELFRVSIKESHHLYNSLQDELDEFTKGSRNFAVVVTDRAKVSFRLTVNEERGEWFFISDLGIKFERDDNAIDDADAF